MGNDAKKLIERSFSIDLKLHKKIKHIPFLVNNDYTLLFNSHRYVKTRSAENSEIFLCYKENEIPLVRKDSFSEFEKNWIHQQDESLTSDISELITSAYSKAKKEDYAPLQKKVIEVILDLHGRSDKKSFHCREWTNKILGEIKQDWYLEKSSVLEQTLKDLGLYYSLIVNGTLYRLNVGTGGIENKRGAGIKVKNLGYYSLKPAKISLQELKEQYFKKLAFNIPFFILKYFPEMLEEKIIDAFDSKNIIPENVFDNEVWVKKHIGFKKNADGSYYVFKELPKPWAWKVPNRDPSYLVFPNPKKGLNKTTVAIRLCYEDSKVILHKEIDKFGKPVILGEPFEHPYISSSKHVCFGSPVITKWFQMITQSIAVLHDGENNSGEHPPVYNHIDSSSYKDADWRTKEELELNNISHLKMTNNGQMIERIAPVNTYR